MGEFNDWCSVLNIGYEEWKKLLEENDGFPNGVPNKRQKQA